MPSRGGDRSIVLFVMLAFVVFALVVRNSYRSEQDGFLFDENHNYLFGLPNNQDWSRVCLASQYTWPQLELPDLVGSSCLREEQVPENKSFIIYTSPLKGCLAVHEIEANFLSESLIEIRCFERGEIEGEHLIREDGIIYFGDSYG